MTFALGLILGMTAVTYGIRPAGGHPTGWGSERVLILLGGALGARPFATAGMLLTARGFGLLLLLPTASPTSPSA